MQEIVDDANAATAILRNQVIGTQANDILRDPTRLYESAMGNLVADAMRLKYPGVDAALTNSGGLRADLPATRRAQARQPCRVTWGEMFAVLPFGNRTVIATLTGAQLGRRSSTASRRPATRRSRTGRFPQVSGLKVEFHCTGMSRWSTRCGRRRTASAAR